MRRDDAGCDEKMADGCDESRECHYECACSDCAPEVHAEKEREDDEHHHPSSRTHEARTEAYGEAEEERYGNILCAHSRFPGSGVLLLGIRLNEESDSYTEGEKEREGTEDDTSGPVCDKGAENAHGDDAYEHYPASSEVDVSLPPVDDCRHGGGDDVTSECDCSCRVRSAFSRERGAEDNQNRNHYGCGAEARKARSYSRPERGKHIPQILTHTGNIMVRFPFGQQSFFRSAVGISDSGMLRQRRRELTTF